MKTFSRNSLLLAAITAVVVGSFAAQPAFAEEGSETALEGVSADTNFPEFASRRDRHEYFQKLREDDPEKFREIMEKRKEYRGQKHPGQSGPRRDFSESRRDAKQNGSWHDRRENRWDGNRGPDRVRPSQNCAHCSMHRS